MRERENNSEQNGGTSAEIDNVIRLLVKTNVRVTIALFTRTKH